MQDDVVIRDVRFTAAPERLRPSGLLGWVSCVINEIFRLQGLTIRRTSGGAIAISFPRRKDEHGVEHRYFEPMSDAVRRAVERQILESIGLWAEAGDSESDVEVSR